MHTVICIYRKYFLSLIIVFFLPVSNAHAFSADQKFQTLKRVENYLNSIRSLKANFLQLDEQGGIAEGMLYILRPGRIRFEYTPPSPIEIIGTGKWLIYHDFKLQQVSRYPIRKTPLAFLVEDKFTFASDNIHITHLQAEDGFIEIQLSSPQDFFDTSVILVFEDRPLKLKQWHVRDASGNTTRVSLSDLKVGIKLEEGLFQFTDPYPFADDVMIQAPE